MDFKDIQSLFRSLQRRLHRLRTLWRLNEAARGLAFTAGILSILILIGTLAGRGWWLRAALLAIAAAAAAVSFVFTVPIPLIRKITDEDVALFLENKYPWLRNRLITCLQLWERYRKGEATFSPSMYETMLLETGGEAGKFSSLQILKWRPTVRTMSVFAVVCVVYLVLAFRAPGFSGRTLNYISPPYLPPKEVFQLTNITGDAVVQRGGAVRIEASFSGEMHGLPFIELQREALEPFVIQMSKRATSTEKEGSYSFRTSVSPVTDDMEYIVKYKNFRSRSYRIQAIDPPAIRSMRVHLQYPPHTGILPETTREGGDIRAPYGAAVTLEITPTSPLERAWIELDGRKKDCALTPKNRAQVGFRVMRSGRYRIHLVDKYGFKNTTPPSFSITSLPDEAPSIQLLVPKTDLRQARTEPVVIQASARDDYLVDSVALHYSVLGTDKRGTEKIHIEKGQNLNFEYQWRILRIKAYENDTVEFYLKVTDNDVLTGPKSAFSEKRRILLISINEDYKQIEKTQEEVMMELESALREGDSISDQFRDLRRDISSGTVGAKQQADLQRALQRQENLEQEITALTRKIEDINERMQQNRLITPETVEKMLQINQLMNDLLSDELKNALETIREAVKQTDVSGLDKLLMDSVLDQEKIMRSLDLTLTRLKRIQAEQKMESLTTRMKGLVEEQEKITQAIERLRQKQASGEFTSSERAEADRLAKEEQEMRSELRDVMSGIEDLQKMFEEFDHELAKKTDEVSKNAHSDATESDLRRAAEKLSEFSPGGAKPPADAALKRMEAFSQALAGLQEDYFANSNAAVIALIQSALRKTLNISTRQEELLPSLEEIKNEPPQNLKSDRADILAKDEKFLQGTTGKLYRDLLTLAGMTMAISMSALEDARNAADKLQGAVTDLTAGDAMRAYTSVREAYLSMNRLAIELTDAAQRARKFGARMELEEYLRRMEEIARSQQGLNEATQKLGDSGLPIPSMSGALQQLALQQAMLSEGMGKLLGEMGNLGEIGKRLDQIQEEMEEVARALREGSADREVQKRQSNILRRLQDATLSLRKESLEEKRIAETGKEYEPAKPTPLYLRGKTAMPDEIRLEIMNYRKMKYPEGFERPIERYYDELNK
ncbi:MAG: hypothetical protein AB1546_05855 [bacterium]